VRQETGDLRQEIAAVRQETGDLRQEIAAVRQETGDLRQEIAAVRQETGDLRQEIAAVRQETGDLRQEIAAVRQETGDLRQEIGAVEGRMRQEMSALGTDLRGEIADAKRHMGVLAEGLRHELQLVAEAVQLQSERMTDIRREVELQARETQALFRLSFEQIYQRVQDLERRVLVIEQRLGL
jgi:chromosome segregation ATPase